MNFLSLAEKPDKSNIATTSCGLLITKESYAEKVKSLILALNHRLSPKSQLKSLNLVTTVS
jgi:hypothetical protein